jgi:hypothetical protein
MQSEFSETMALAQLSNGSGALAPAKGDEAKATIP